MDKSSKPFFVPDKNLVKDNRYDKKDSKSDKSIYNSFYHGSKYIGIKISKQDLNEISDEAKMKYKVKSDPSTHNTYKRKPKNT